MKQWDPKQIQATIELKLKGVVVPQHNEHGHFYQINDGMHTEPPVYPSVTGKLQILKDESIANFKMNRALDHIFAHYSEFTDANIMEHIGIAKAASGVIFQDAGDIGTRIHDYREKIFEQWMQTGIKPEDFLSFIPEAEYDIRAVSALRALRSFCDEQDYIPVACELLVYNHDFKIAGTLDDLGLMRKVIREGGVKDGPTCDHMDVNLEGKKESLIIPGLNGKFTCMRCGYQHCYQLVLLDLKSSNQFKDHYFFQVAMYFWMFSSLTAIKPERCLILKVSKEDGSYKLEDLKRPAKLAQYARAMLKTHEGMEFIKLLRKDNQRKVLKI